MLQKLTIKNYSIIQDIEINFSPHLNIITGETGAGKSILLGALGLIFGDRADTSVLNSHDEKCIVEGLFQIQSLPSIHFFLTAHQLESDTELIIRKEISPSGKSRAFINDTPVNIVQLQQLSNLLVDMHQQFDTAAIAENDFQKNIIDALAKNGELLQQYKQIFKQWIDKKSEQETLKKQIADFKKEYDYNQYLHQELESLNLQPNELETIDSELNLLQSSEEIKQSLDNIEHELNDGETPILNRLRSIKNKISHFSDKLPALHDLEKRLNAIHAELQDINAECSKISSRMLVDQSEINLLQERISAGYKLQKKHAVQSTEGLISIQNQLAEKLKSGLQLDDEVAANEKQIAELQQSLQRLAANISAGRQKQIDPFEKAVNQLLFQIGMPNASLKVDIQKAGLQQDGSDEINFLFDANKSGRFLPIKKVASGGELSRLMLCIKSLIAESVDLPTMIFDEIDTGISGETAKQVGQIMKQLGSQRQVISITHQPQIAGKADQHFYVYKTPENGRIATKIKTLSMEERVAEIAKMINGENISATALGHAKEMMSN